MAWKGRSDLEKLMRKANDRLRSLERVGETRSTAYKEALRQMRIAEGSADAVRPRFSVSHFGTEKEMKLALEKFMRMETSTVRGVKSADVKTAEKISKHTNTKISSSDVKKIGKVWEAIRGRSGKYNAATDLARQKIIVKHMDKPAGEISDVIHRMESDGVKIDQWEKQFDRYSKLEQPTRNTVDDTPLH